MHTHPLEAQGIEGWREGTLGDGMSCLTHCCIWKTGICFAYSFIFILYFCSAGGQTQGLMNIGKCSTIELPPQSIFFFSVLGFELRSYCLLDECSMTW
jgi:hypothetical protein